MADEVVPRGHPGEVAARDGMRASHEDRDTVVEQLRVAGGDGRLDAEELDERVGAALSARTYGELAALVADLPAGAVSPVNVPAVVPKEVVRIDCGSGNAKRDSHWAVPRQMAVRVRSGGVKLTLITKPGIVVDADDVAVRSGGVRVKSPWGSSVPVTLRIDITGKVSSGNITARPPRRSFWEWLRRTPRRYALPPGPR